MKKSTLILSALLTGIFTAAHAGEDMSTKLAKLVSESFKPGEGQDMSRLVQDDTQKACSQYRNNPPEKVASDIIVRERANIKYPEDNKLMGDWKKRGEAGQRRLWHAHRQYRTRQA